VLQIGGSEHSVHAADLAGYFVVFFASLLAVAKRLVCEFALEGRNHLRSIRRTFWRVAFRLV
jgi:hypothetical protein